MNNKQIIKLISLVGLIFIFGQLIKKCSSSNPISVYKADESEFDIENSSYRITSIKEKNIHETSLSNSRKRNYTRNSNKNSIYRENSQNTNNNFDSTKGVKLAEVKDDICREDSPESEACLKKKEEDEKEKKKKKKKAKVTKLNKKKKNRNSTEFEENLDSDFFNDDSSTLKDNEVPIAAGVENAENSDKETALEKEIEERTINDWSAVLLEKYNFINISKFTQFYKTGHIKPEIYFGILGKMVSSEDLRYKEVGVLSLGAVPHIISFTTLAQLKYSINDEKEKFLIQIINKKLLYYSEIGNLHILKAALYHNELSVLKEAINTLSLSINFYLNNNNVNSSQATTTENTFMTHFSDFAPVLEDITISSNDISLKQTALNLKNKLSLFSNRVSLNQ